MCSSVLVLCCLFYVSLGDLLALYYVQFCFGSVLLMFDFSFEDFLALYYVQFYCGCVLLRLISVSMSSKTYVCVVLLWVCVIAF